MAIYLNGKYLPKRYVNNPCLILSELNSSISIFLHIKTYKIADLGMDIFHTRYGTADLQNFRIIRLGLLRKIKTSLTGVDGLKIHHGILNRIFVLYRDIFRLNVTVNRQIRFGKEENKEKYNG